MFFAICLDEYDDDENCLAQFETERARDEWCKVFDEYEPISSKEANHYDLSGFNSGECYQVGRDSWGRAVFAIDI